MTERGKKSNPMAPPVPHHTSVEDSKINNLLYAFKTEDSKQNAFLLQLRELLSFTELEKFLDVLRQFKSGELEPLLAVRNISTLFQGNRELILSSNVFMPTDLSIGMPQSGPIVLTRRLPTGETVSEIANGERRLDLEQSTGHHGLSSSDVSAISANAGSEIAGKEAIKKDPPRSAEANEDEMQGRERTVNVAATVNESFADAPAISEDQNPHDSPASMHKLATTVEVQIEPTSKVSADGEIQDRNIKTQRSSEKHCSGPAASTSSKSPPTATVPIVSTPLETASRSEGRVLLNPQEYLKRVKREYAGDSDICSEFLKAIRSLKAGHISVLEVIQRVSTLFRGNLDLTLGFSAFLPEGYSIELLPDSGAVPVVVIRDGTEAKTFPIDATPSTEMKSQRRKQNISCVVDAKLSSGQGESSLPQPSQRVRAALESTEVPSDISNGNDEDRAKGSRNGPMTGKDYVNMVKTWSSDRPGVLVEVLHVIKTFMSEKGKTVPKVQRLFELFEGNPSLILEFNTFLPEGHKIEKSGGVNEMPTFHYILPGQTVALRLPDLDATSSATPPSTRKVPKRKGSKASKKSKKRRSPKPPPDEENGNAEKTPSTASVSDEQENQGSESPRGTADNSAWQELLGEKNLNGVPFNPDSVGEAAMQVAVAMVPNQERVKHKEILCKFFDDSDIERVGDDGAVSLKRDPLQVTRQMRADESELLAAVPRQLNAVATDSSKASAAPDDSLLRSVSRRKCYAAIDLPQLEHDTREWHAARRARLRRNEVQSFTLRFNECSVTALSKWAGAGPQRTAGRSIHMPAILRMQPTIDAKFRLCAVCKKWGHYEIECRQLKDTHIVKLGNSLADLDDALCSASMPEEPPCATKKVDVRAPDAVLEMCGGFFLEQRAGADETKRCDVVPPREQGSRAADITEIDDIVVEAGKSAAAFSSDSQIFFAAGDWVAWERESEDSGKDVLVGIVVATKEATGLVCVRCRWIVTSTGFGDTEFEGQRAWMKSSGLFLLEEQISPSSSKRKRSEKDSAKASGGSNNKRYRRLERLNEDGTIEPRTSPRKLKNGTFAAPKGRQPVGLSWDKARGVWKPTHKK